MSERFDPDPNKPGWGTFVNDAGKAVYDYFPNMAPPTNSLSPSASPTPAAPAPAAAPATSPVASPNVTPGATPRAAQLLDAVGAVTKPRADGLVKTAASSSTTTVPGRSQTAIDRDKSTALGTANELKQTNTDVANARREREVTSARTAGTAAVGERDEAASREASATLQKLDANQKLSDKLLEKDPELDSRRLINNMSTGQLVLTAILAGLTGGFASVAGMKENPALVAINRAIDQDIADQEKQIESGRILRNNQIQHYRELGMDAKQARDAARADRLSASQKMVAAYQDELGAAANTEQAQLLNAAIDKQHSDLVMSLDTQGESRTQTTSSSQFDRPKPAGGDIGDMLKALQLKNSLVDQADAAEIGKVVGREVSPEQAKDIKTDAKEYAKARATNENARRAVKRVADQVGLVLNADTGLYEPGPNGVDVDVLPTEEKRKVERAYAGMKEAQVMRMAREPSAKLQDEFGSVLDRPFFDDEIAGQLNSVLEGLRGADENLRSGYGEGATLFDSRGAGTSPLNSGNVRKPQ